MGSSYVEYCGRGFWSFDGYLQHFLATLAARITNHTEPWIAAARDHWDKQAQGPFDGWMHPRFDEILTDDDRRSLVSSLADEIARASQSPRELAETATLMVRLLRGELSTDQSSPLDYMVTGSHPYPWQ